MQHSPSSEANNSSDSQEIPRICESQRFIAAFTRDLILNQINPFHALR
jgi:hypothetical protein